MPRGASASARDSRISALIALGGRFVPCVSFFPSSLSRKRWVARIGSSSRPRARASETRCGPSRIAWSPLLRRSRRIAFTVSFSRLAIMAHNLREFLGEYQRGIEVCVVADGADALLGVRDAFLRFFRDDLGKPLPVAVVPQEPAIPRRHDLALSDEAAIERARQSARELE